MRLRIAVALCLLAFSSEAGAQDDSPPNRSDQQRILTLMRHYVANYKVPDVAYDQTTTTFSGNRLRSGDTPRIYHDGREYMCCRLGKNRKPVPGEWQEAWSGPDGPLFPWNGDEVTVVWNRWDTLRLQHLAVFDFRVSKENSTALACDKPEWSGGFSAGHVTCGYSEKIPYRGSIWIDPEIGAIWRCSITQDDYPKRYTIRYNTYVEDYDRVLIGETAYMLLVMDSGVTRTRIDSDRFERSRRNFHKFEADSTITFFSADSSIKYK